ncbi:MAG: flavin reductase family protein [Ruminococcaceae bacterium]|nr:flavin reductase family protein [Oscillospiraceae bacterium]
MKLTEAKFNFAEKIAKSALLTATKGDGALNTMTVSWGGSGILWGKEVCFVFVRPERYTFEFCEDGDTMSLSFFGKERKDTLALCGTKSGRDVDKFEACGLKFTVNEGACVFDDAEITVILKKLYAQDLDEDCFESELAKPFYANGGYHRMYICEIKDIITA